MTAGLVQDVRLAARALLRSPGFTAVAVLSLALGVGASSSLYSVMSAVLLRPLPYHQPDRLMMVRGTDARDGSQEQPSSFADFRDLRAQAHAVSTLVAASPLWSFALTGEGPAEQISGLYLSAGSFDLLGVPPARGRAFLPEEDRAGAAPVVILGHGLWQRRFGGDPGVLGRTLNLSGTPSTVVGIMPPGFRFLQPDAELWVPLEQNQFAASARNVRLLSVVGRLRPGVTERQAAAEIDTLGRRLRQQHPDSNGSAGLRLLPLQAQITGPVRPVLMLLLAAVGLLLAITCANLANLLLVRTAARRRESAVRAALGASRWRLARALLVESLLLALLGGGAGALLAWLGTDLLLASAPLALPRYHPVRVDGGVLLFTVAVSLLSGLLFGLAPARQLGGVSVQPALRAAGPGLLGDRRQHRLSGALVVAEVALAVVLVAAGGLLIRSFQRLLAVDPGLHTTNLLTMQVGLPAAGYQQPERRQAFYQQLEQALGALPGVSAVGLVTRLPLQPAMNNITSTLAIQGRPVAPAARPEIDFRRASSGYFVAAGIPLLRGRLLTSQDAAARAVLINEAAARRFWPGPDPLARALGQRISTATNTGVDTAWQTVVGVVGDVHHLDLHRAPRPEIYYHTDTLPPFGPVLVLRGPADPRALLPAVRETIRQLDDQVPLSRVQTMAELVEQSVAPRRFGMLLVNAFAAVALLLAAMGIYGVMAFSVTRRTRELGVRAALGASPARVLTGVLARGLGLTLAGLALGLAGAFLTTHLMKALLFGVGATDPLTFAAVTLVLLLAAGLACYLPARRATRIDPLVALRAAD